MRFTQQEKMEIIRIVEGSELGVNRTLKQLGIHKSTFYNWYKQYQEDGYDGLAPRGRQHNPVWNRIPDEMRGKVIDMALDEPELSSRELACRMTDVSGYFISESSVYRILKAADLITGPAMQVLSAGDEFYNKTGRVNQMWQTDFTYLKVVGWGWYYLSTVLDDYSRYIIAWELCSTMTATDANRTLELALNKTGLDKKRAPKLLSDNGSCYISGELQKFVEDKGIMHVRGAPCHPQTQGKIERYHRTMKNVIKLDNYYSPGELEHAIDQFVEYYNTRRYHESLNNVTPEDVFLGRENEILERRKRIKEKTIKQRRKNYLYQKLKMT